MLAKEQYNYRKYSLITVILVLGLILFLKITPFMSGFLGAFTLYIMMRGQMIYLTEKRGVRRSLSAVLLLTEAVLCFLVPLGLAAWLIVNRLQTVNVSTEAVTGIFMTVVNELQQQIGYDLLSKDNLSSLASVIPTIGQILMGGISSFVVNIFALILILYFMLIGGRAMERYIYDLLPFSDHNKDSVLKEVKVIVRSNAIGIPLLALIQGGIAMLGYYLFDSPSIWLLGFLTCFATAIPIVGTALVWFPLAVYMALTGDWAQALGLVVYCSLFVTNIDNLIRFVLQKKMADTHPLVTIFGVIIGLSLFGFMGIIFGPLLLSLFLLCVDIFKNEHLTPKAPVFVPSSSLQSVEGEQEASLQAAKAGDDGKDVEAQG